VSLLNTCYVRHGPVVIRLVLGPLLQLAGCAGQVQSTIRASTHRPKSAAGANRQRVVPRFSRPGKQWTPTCTLRDLDSRLLVVEVGNRLVAGLTSLLRRFQNGCFQ
jgi:hypothetical protein